METFHILKLESAKLGAPELKVSPWGWLKLCLLSQKMKDFEGTKDTVKLSENRRREKKSFHSEQPSHG